VPEPCFSRCDANHNGEGGTYARTHARLKRAEPQIGQSISK